MKSTFSPAMKRMVRQSSARLPRSFKWYLHRTWLFLRSGRQSFSPYVVSKDIEGSTFDLLLGDRVGEEWYKDQNTLVPELKFMRDQMVRAGDVILECGAHHGFTTILLANWVGPQGCVVAIEASPSSARILKSNIELNGIRNVIVEAKAVSAQDDQITIFQGSNSAIVPDRQRWGTLRVPATSLDHYAGLNPTLLKLDVEGYELQALRGATEILKRVPRLAIEVHMDLIRQYNGSADDIFQLIQKDRYRFWIQLGGDQEPRPYDGELLAEQHQAQVHLYGIPR